MGHDFIGHNHIDHDCVDTPGGLRSYGFASPRQRAETEPTASFRVGLRSRAAGMH